MCLDCGCGRPSDRHDDLRHITLTDLDHAAQASRIPVEQAAWNIPATLTAAPGYDPASAVQVTGKPTLCFDMDGVLSSTVESCCAALNARYGTSYMPMTQRFFPGILDPTALPAEQGSWLAAQLTGWDVLGTAGPDWQAARTLLDAANAGYPVQVVTGRPANLAGPTVAWLKDWGITPVPRVHATAGQKPAWMHARYGPEQPAILIDDNPAIRMSIAAPGIETWLPARPYNHGPARANTRTFTTWAEARYWLGLSPAPGP